MGVYGMSIWLVVATLPVAVSTVLAVSASMLSSRRNRMWEGEDPQPRRQESPIPQAVGGASRTAGSLPLPHPR